MIYAYLLFACFATGLAVGVRLANWATARQVDTMWKAWEASRRKARGDEP